MNGSSRVHKVFHRIGTVFGGLLVVGGLLAIGGGAIGSFSTPTRALKVSDVYTYPMPKEAPGGMVVYPDGSAELASVFLERENMMRASRHSNDIGSMFAWGLGLLICGGAVYGLCRAVGWIIAGAFA